MPLGVPLGDVRSSNAAERSPTIPTEKEQAAPVVLRININLGPFSQCTSMIQAAAPDSIASVLDTVCRKRQLGRPERFVLMFHGSYIMVPPESTVAALREKRELTLVPHREWQIQTQIAREKEAQQAASSQPKYSSAMDIIAHYKVRRTQVSALTTGVQCHAQKCYTHATSRTGHHA